MQKPVITRFAPSPTGLLHIGSARTALFNWLYARANDGKMLLRIEDTDRQRSSKEAINAIYEGLKWLEINWDDEAISQFSRAGRHREVALQLLAEGKAYQCYASAEELKEMRETVRKGPGPVTYRWRNEDPALAPPGVKPVIRLKTPDTGETVVKDQIQGDVIFQNRDLDDMVLLRSDGSPTYMHAVVVDDHDMDVTHIIRGDDHLTNAARQILLYHALEWESPSMAHIPLIHGPDGTKLSKRHGAPGIEAYRAMGYLPQALRNYLVRLGWSHGDDEIISTQQMIEWFDLKAIGKGSSRLDFTRLESLNGYYIRNGDNTILFKKLLENARFLKNGRYFTRPLSKQHAKYLIRVIPLLKEKVKTLNELAIFSHFIFLERPIELDEKAKKILDCESRTKLAQLLPFLEKSDAWNKKNLNAIVRNFCQESGIGLGKVAQPIRCAITGTTLAPDVFEIMELFGYEEVLARIRDQLLRDDHI